MRRCTLLAQGRLAIPELTRRSLFAGADGLPFRSGVGPAEAEPWVSIASLAFVPAEVMVAVGQTAAIIDGGGIQHTSTAGSGVFNIDDLVPGRSVDLTFPTAGTYPYY